MEQRDYSKDLPLCAPKGVLEWLIEKKGAFKKQYLIYRVQHYTDPLTGENKKGVAVSCTKCGQGAIHTYVKFEGGCRYGLPPAPFGFYHPVTGEDIASGSLTLCPECGAQAEAKHIGAIPNGITDEAWAMTVGRLEDKVVLLGWLFRRAIDKAGRSDYWSQPYEAYVVEEKKIVRLMGYQRCLSSISLFGHWEQRKTYRDSWGYAPAIYPWDPAILEGSTGENSKLDLYLRDAPEDEAMPVTYMRVWQKHRNVENLLVQGCGSLVHEAMEKEGRRYSYAPAPGTPKMPDVNWKEKRPSAMLGLNKEELACCKAQRWKLEDLRNYKIVRNVERIRPMEDMAVILKDSRYGVESLAKNDRGGLSVMRCLRYMEKQREKTKIHLDAGYLLDYWKMAETLGWDLADVSLRLPKDLVRSHDRASRELAEIKARNAAEKLAKEIAERAEAFAARTQFLQACAWEADGLLIRPATDEQELIRKGKLLHHCVARYAEDVAKGKTAIFFIRKTERPAEPFYTLELDEKNITVRQNRGSYNCDRTKEVADFEGKWLNHLRAMKAAGGLKAKKKKTAAA